MSKTQKWKRRYAPSCSLLISSWNPETGYWQRELLPATRTFLQSVYPANKFYPSQVMTYVEQKLPREEEGIVPLALLA
eukprot:scaffold24339_cov122-Cylindrotheca_fusiformis.AAC.3